jgi:hypothetical protein
VKQGIWGKIKGRKVVHYYLPGSTESICGRVQGRNWQAPEWDEKSPGTCKHCLEQLKNIKAGFIPEPVTVQ